LREVVAPVGWGLAGLVAAGLIGAILSSIDSMLNSAATLITFDIYGRFINPQASEQQMIKVGRICITLFVIGSALLTIFIFDPNSREPFFTYVAKHQSRLIPGLVVAFGMGMLWKGATASGGFWAIITGMVVSYALLPIYAATLGKSETVAAWLGSELNFFHAVFIAALSACLVHVVVSISTQGDAEKSKLTWEGLGLISHERLMSYARRIGLTVFIFIILGACIVQAVITPPIAAIGGAGWTLGITTYATRQSPRNDGESGLDDRYLAGLLASCAVFVLFYFY